MPREYMEFVLCDRFKCLPSQLRREKMSDVLNFINMIDVENRVAEQRRGK